MACRVRAPPLTRGSAGSLPISINVALMNPSNLAMYCDAGLVVVEGNFLFVLDTVDSPDGCSLPDA